MFTGDTKLGGVAAALQKDLSKVERWVEKNCLKFSRGKFRVLHLWRNNLRHQHGLGADLLEGSSAGKDLGVWLDSKLSLS